MIRLRQHTNDSYGTFAAGCSARTLRACQITQAGESGFERIEAEDITRHVRETWTRCAALARRKEVRALLKVSDARTRRFVESFSAIQQAYDVGAMAYGMFTARKFDR